MTTFLDISHQFNFYLIHTSVLLPWILEDDSAIKRVSKTIVNISSFSISIANMEIHNLNQYSHRKNNEKKCYNPNMLRKKSLLMLMKNILKNTNKMGKEMLKYRSFFLFLDRGRHD